MRSPFARVTALLAVKAGLTHALSRRRRRRRDHRLFVLVYHDVASRGDEREGVVTAERFERHLAYLRRHYRFGGLEETCQRLDRGEALDRDVATITFDDGYRDNARVAAPLLSAAGATATFFVTTGFIDGRGLWFDRLGRSLDAVAGERGDSSALARCRETLFEQLGSDTLRLPREAALERAKRLAPTTLRRLLDDLEDRGLDSGVPAEPMTWTEIRQLLEQGFEIGSHTVDHPILSRLEAPEQEREVVESKRRLAEQTGTTPVTFAYPNGASSDYDGTTIALLREHGFRAACTTRRGSNAPGQDVLTLQRIPIGADTVVELEARLSGLFDDWARTRLTAGAVGRERRS